MPVLEMPKVIPPVLVKAAVPIVKILVSASLFILEAVAAVIAPDNVAAPDPLINLITPGVAAKPVPFIVIFSTVEYDATQKLGFYADPIYQGCIDLFLDDATRDYAVRLWQASYLAGDNSVKSFIRFIPTSLYDTIGFNKASRETQPFKT